jgi:hypothetical protein
MLLAPERQNFVLEGGIGGTTSIGTRARLHHHTHLITLPEALDSPGGKCDDRADQNHNGDEAGIDLVQDGPDDHQHYQAFEYTPQHVSLRLLQALS